MDIQKRFDRVVAIYFHLQAKPVVKAQDLAEKFDVSIRTIYRDIKSLEHAGVPIYGEAGTGYSLVNNYKIPPTLFSEEEALSFAVAEKLMQHYLDAGMSKSFSDALLKMRAVLRHTDKEHLAQVESKVFINKGKHFLNEAVPLALAILFESIAKRKQVKLLYQSVDTDSPAERIIETIGVFQESEFWYFMAYCHLRSEVRQFRLDRIQDIQLLASPNELQHESLAKHLANKQIAFQTAYVRIKVDRKIAKYLVWERHYYGFLREEIVENGDYVEMHFECKDLKGGFLRWYMMFADQAEILEPISLKKELKELIDSYTKKIQAY